VSAGCEDRRSDLRRGRRILREVGSCGAVEFQVWGRGCGWSEGGADDATPGVGAEGADVFVFGEVDGLDEGLAEVGEDGGGLGLDVPLGDGGKEVAEGGTEVAGGEVRAGEVRRDFAADLVGGAGLGFLTGVEGAEVRMGGGAGSAAAAAVGEGERTQGGTVLGEMCRHRSAPDYEI